MTEHDLELIKTTIQETIAELKRQGLLKNVSDQAYKDAQDVIRVYYAEGKRDERMAAVMRKIQKDKYFKIIPMHFGYHYTLEEIAEALDVEVSTVSRNKKRICMRIYNLLEM